MTTRVVELGVSPSEAWTRVLAAAQAIGTVKEVQEPTRSLLLKARYGLNPVNLRVAVLSGAAENTSIIDLRGRGQDVWGGASRKVIDRLIAAL